MAGLPKAFLEPPSRSHPPRPISLLVSGTNISRFDFSSSIPKLLISCPLASERVVTTLGHCPADPCPSRGSPQKEVKAGMGSGRCFPFKSKFFTATHFRCPRSCEEAKSSFLEPKDIWKLSCFHTRLEHGMLKLSTSFSRFLIPL